VTYRKVEVRSCSSQDEGLLFGLASLAFADQDERRTLTTLSHDTVFIAELEGEPVGWVAVEPVETSVRVEQLVVHPAHEGEGVARQLLDWVEGFAISRGARTLQIVVEMDNVRARTFYTGRGYVAANGDVLERLLPGS
jgi:ribosomal protein S18 acetylase RimI-like enzyme